MIQIHKALCFIWSYFLQRRFKTKERVSFFSRQYCRHLLESNGCLCDSLSYFQLCFDAQQVRAEVAGRRYIEFYSSQTWGRNMKGKFCQKEENGWVEDDEQKPVRMPRMVVLTHFYKINGPSMVVFYTIRTCLQNQFQHIGSKLLVKYLET